VQYTPSVGETHGDPFALKAASGSRINASSGPCASSAVRVRARSATRAAMLRGRGINLAVGKNGVHRRSSESMNSQNNSRGVFRLALKGDRVERSARMQALKQTY